jgi:hypothetical protein
VQERGNGPLFVEAVLGREIQNVDAAKLSIVRVTDRALDGGNGIAASRLSEHAEEGFDLAHL